jgi:hypothetical protein
MSKQEDLSDQLKAESSPLEVVRASGRNEIAVAASYNSFGAQTQVS